MPTSTGNSQKPYARLSPEARGRVLDELKRIHDSGAIAPSRPKPTLRERVAQLRKTK